MKTFRTKLRSSLLLSAMFVAVPLWAKPVAQVTSLTGQVFVVTEEGKTKSLKLNDHLDEKSEVMVEEGGTITLNDYFDATYHLIGGSHMKFFTKSVQLKRGKTWIQAKNARHALALTTANGNVTFWKAEFIATFDQANSRSQILVVNGDAEVSNVLDKNMKYMIPAGSFTLVDPEVENGIPRSPTKVGLASLNSALAEFKQLPNKMKDEGLASAPSRAIASVTETTDSEKPAVKKGEIIFMTTNRMPASVTGNAHAYFKKKSVAQTKAQKAAAKAKLLAFKATLASAPIKVYGEMDVPVVVAPQATNEERSPASVPNMAKMPQKASDKVNLDQEFGDSLKKHGEEQPKYSNDMENLIRDLKSY
ncbi:MAG TPA: hypothetical protein VNJ08_05020 [Bacteriovoracaceae bacterium]|nr:hypothetical protein [Bacteriovoracaceae bacterium]